MIIKKYLLELSNKVEKDKKYRDIVFSYADKFTIINLIDHCFDKIIEDKNTTYFQVLLKLQELLYYILISKDRKIWDNLWKFVSEFDRAIHPELQELYLKEIKNWSFQKKIDWISIVNSNNWKV